MDADVEAPVTVPTQLRHRPVPPPAAGSAGSPGTPDASLGDYARWLRAALPVVLLCAALGAAAGTAAALLLPERWTSRVEVLVGPTSIDSDVAAQALARPPSLDTEATLVSSGRVVTRAAEALTPEQGDGLAARVSVSAPPNTRVLRIDVTGSSAEDAQAGAGALASAYLEERAAIFDGRRVEQLAGLQSDYDLALSELRTAQERLRQAPADSADRDLLTLRVVSTRQVTTRLEGRLASLARQTVDVGEVLRPARLPEEPSGPQASVPVTSGVAAGLLLGATVSLVRQGGVGSTRWRSRRPPVRRSAQDAPPRPGSRRTRPTVHRQDV